MEDFATLYLDVIPRAMKILRAEMRKEAKHYLSVPQFRILANVNRGMKTINEISTHQGVSQPAMSKMIEILVQKGLLLRESNPQDRRCCVLKMTSEGKSLFNKIRKNAHKNLDSLARDVGVSEPVLSKALSSLQSFVEKVDGRA